VIAFKYQHEHPAASLERSARPLDSGAGVPTIMQMMNIPATE